MRCLLLAVTCLVALAGCDTKAVVGGKECTLVGCNSGAFIALPVPHDSPSFARSVVSVCRNGACVEGKFPASLPSYPGTGYGLDFSGSASAHGTLFMDDGGGFSLHIEYDVTDAALLADGDRYRVEVVDGSGAVIAVADRAVSYATATPNGEGCPPTCRQARLDCSQGCSDGAPTCSYNGMTYADGEVFPAGDGCNTCKCNPTGTMPGQVGCSLIACDAGA